MDPRTWLMVQLAAITASEALCDYRAMLAAVLNAGVTPVEAKEIVYQAVPYVGLAKVFDFVHATNDVLTERGVTLSLPAQSKALRKIFLRKASRSKSRVRDELVDRLCASAPADQQHIQRFPSANCFGNWVARSGIGIARRELLTFSMLAALVDRAQQIERSGGANERQEMGRDVDQRGPLVADSEVRRDVALDLRITPAEGIPACYLAREGANPAPQIRPPESCRWL